MAAGTLNTGGEILCQLHAVVDNLSKVITHGQVVNFAGQPTRTLEDFGIKNQDTMLQIYGMGAAFRSKVNYGHLYPIDVIEDEVLKNMDQLKPLLDFEWELAEKVSLITFRNIKSMLIAAGLCIYPSLPTR